MSKCCNFYNLICSKTYITEFYTIHDIGESIYNILVSTNHNKFSVFVKLENDVFKFKKCIVGYKTDSVLSKSIEYDIFTRQTKYYNSFIEYAMKKIKLK